MQITLDGSLFDQPSDEEGLKLAELLLVAVRDEIPHIVRTDPIYEPANNRGALHAWLESRPAHENRAFRSVLARSLLNARGPRNEATIDGQTPPRFGLPGRLSVRAERGVTSDWRARRLTLADTVNLLHEPLHLILENGRTDRTVVLFLADATNRDVLRKLIDAPGRIHPHGGGSGEIKHWLEGLLAGEPTPVQWRRMLRTWVLFDRDAGDEDALAPSRSAAQIVELCQKVVAKFGPGLTWTCLGRREIESYVPDKALLDESTDPQKPFVRHVTAWRAREDRKAWAWSVDLKNGLMGDRHPNWNEGLSMEDAKEFDRNDPPLVARMLKDPFRTLTEDEVRDMKRGIGKKKLGEALLAVPEKAWISDISTEYDRGPADQVPRLALVQSLFDRA